MPRKAHGAKLEKVVSTTITLEDFNLLEKYARIRYNENKIKQPTISHLLRKNHNNDGQMQGEMKG